MARARLYEQIRALLQTEPDQKNGDWWQYPCVLCGGKRHHKWGPLGINVNSGKIRCFRCGFSGRIKLESVGTYDPQDPIDYYTSYDPEELMADELRNKKREQEIDAYMARRGVPFGYWKYGIGAASGRIVFPSWSPEGHLWYWQARSPSKTASIRYLGPDSSPRLDFSWGISGDYSDGPLYLVEGPVDACVMRDKLRVWASATYSTSPSSALLQDVHDAYWRGMCDKVVVWYDAEHLAEVRSIRIARRLRFVYGVETYTLAWRWNHGRDQGGIDVDELRRSFYQAKEVKA